MIRRYWIVTILLLITGAARLRLSVPEPVLQAHPLRALPMTIADWTGREVALDPAIVQATGVDDHLSRIYERGSRDAVTLYVAYYRSQRAGRAVHSPLNCLPGNGWEPVTRQRIIVDSSARAIPATINKVVIRRGLDQQLVLYWYQSVDRVTASEYWSKAYLIADAFRSGRTDIALVRVTAPIHSPDTVGEGRALAGARRFAEAALDAVHTQLF